MFLKLESAIAGTNFAYQPGDVVDWPDEDEGERMVERGIAEPLIDGDAAQKVAASSGRPVRRHKSARKATRPQGETATAR